MEKIFKALLIFGIAFCSGFCTNGASACSQDATGSQVTGGACSIRDLNKMETGRVKGIRAEFQLGGGRNLRPVRIGYKKEMEYNSYELKICPHLNMMRGATSGR